MGGAGVSIRSMIFSFWQTSIYVNLTINKIYCISKVHQYFMINTECCLLCIIPNELEILHSLAPILYMVQPFRGINGYKKLTKLQFVYINYIMISN